MGVEKGEEGIERKTWRGLLAPYGCKNSPDTGGKPRRNRRTGFSIEKERKNRTFVLF
jgi:hypothetical protein